MSAIGTTTQNGRRVTTCAAECSSQPSDNFIGFDLSALFDTP